MGKKTTYDYEIIFHLIDNKDMSFTATDQVVNKEALINDITSVNFAILCDSGVAINMRNVLYVEVKELKQEKKDET